MNYAEALAYLDGRLNYERRGMPDNASLRLDRVVALLDRLGNPESKYPIVHVTGTKGKGSTSTMVARMLTSLGAKVGLHTSPHLYCLEERFQVDEQPIAPNDLARLVSQMAPEVAAVDRTLSASQPTLTFFEVTTALMLTYFAEQKVDWGVIEVGMGGRLDSTNVVQPEVSVITSISRDHTRQLGDTLELIAGEKGGIIKFGRPVVSGVTQPGPQGVIAALAREQNSTLRLLGVDFHYRYESKGLSGGRVDITTWRRQWPTLPLTLVGEHQAANAAIAAATLDVLLEQPRDRLANTTAPATFHRLAGALETLIVPGRVEVLREKPLVILDVAHNDASIESLFNILSQNLDARNQPRVLIFGAAKEKEWPSFVRRLAPLFDHIVATQFLNNPRATPASEIVASLAGVAPTVSATESPRLAWTKAKDIVSQAAGPTTPVVCVTGSFYLAAELRAEIDREFNR